MSFTWGNDPTNSNRDAVRSLLNDTVEASAIWTDEEIAWALSAQPNVYLAASQLAFKQAGKLAAQPTLRVGDLAKSYIGTEAQGWRVLAFQYRQLGIQRVSPFSGGISVSNKKSVRSDSDYDRPAARLGIHDYVGTDTT